MNMNGLCSYDTRPPTEKPNKTPTFRANGVIEPSRPRILQQKNQSIKFKHVINLLLIDQNEQKRNQIYLLFAISATNNVTPD